MWWNSWAPAAPATPSSATLPTGPCVARTAARTPTTALDGRRSAWPRPPSPSSTRGPAVSGMTRITKSGSSSFCVHQRLLFFPVPPCVCCLFFKKMWFLFFSVFRLLVCLFFTWNISEVAQRCTLEWMCVRGWVDWGGEASQSNRARVPSVEKLCVHFSTRSPAIHPLIPVMLRPRSESPPSCFIHPSLSSPRLRCFSVLCLSLFVSCVAVFLYKKGALLSPCSASVSLSVCLFLSVWPSSWLSGCRWESEATQWANLTRWIPDGWSSAPSRHDDLTGGVSLRCLYPLPPSVSVCLLVPSVCSPLYPPARLWSLRLEKSFLFPFPLFFSLFNSKRPFIHRLLLVSNSSNCVCKTRMPVTNPTTPPPSQITSVSFNIKAAQTIVSLQLCGIDDTSGSACNYLLLKAVGYRSNKKILSWSLQPKWVELATPKSHQSHQSHEGVLRLANWV